MLINIGPHQDTWWEETILGRPTGQFDVHVCIQQQVLSFQVAVNDVVSVAVIHSCQNLPELLSGFIFTHTAKRCQEVCRVRTYLGQNSCQNMVNSVMVNSALTEHFSVLCILCHDVQHVFGLHDLRGIKGEKKELELGRWQQPMIMHFKCISLKSSLPGNIFWRQSPTLSYFLTNMSHTNHMTFWWYTVLCNPAVSHFLIACCFKYHNTVNIHTQPYIRWK